MHYVIHELVVQGCVHHNGRSNMNIVMLYFMGWTQDWPQAQRLVCETTKRVFLGWDLVGK